MIKTQPRARIEYTRGRVNRYQEDWKSLDRLRDVGWLFEDIIALANQIDVRTLTLDTEIRELGFNGDLHTDDEAALLEANLKLLVDWLSVSQEVIVDADSLAQEYGVVEGLDEFRQHVSEVRDMLTPDSEFFASEELARLRDSAVEEHRSGRTTGLLDDATSRP